MDVEALIQQLTLEEKVHLTAGKSSRSYVPMTKININSISRSRLVAHSRN